MRIKLLKKKIVIPLILFFISIQLINIAFNVSEVSAQADTNIDIEEIVEKLPTDYNYSASIDEKWMKKDYNMLLILPPNSTLIGHGEDPIAWYNETERFASWKFQLGIRCLIVDNYLNFTGRDEAERVRNAIIHYYNNYSIQWVLLIGDTNMIPIRYVYNIDSINLGRSESIGTDTLKPTDFYYADLTGNWDIDEDGLWGEYYIHVQNSNQSETDFYAEVYVGRFPVETVSELTNLINKTILYEQAYNAGDWMNRFLAVSAISDYPYTGDLDGEDEARLNQYILDNYIDDSMNWMHLEEHTSAYTPPERIDPVTNISRIMKLTPGAMKYYMDQGCSIAVFAGHGMPTYFSTYTAGAALSSSDAENLQNLNMPTFLFGDACSTNAYDYEGGLGESFMLRENAGGIGYIGCMRISWYYPNDTSFIADNRAITRLFFYEMFEKGNYQPGKALYLSKIDYYESEWFQSNVSQRYPEVERKSLLGYMLLGDPSISLYTAVPMNFDDPFAGLDVLYTRSIRNITIRDINGSAVPYANIVFYDSEGDLYYLFHANSEGIVQLYLPSHERTLHYTIFAHNMIYRNGTIDLRTDEKAPSFLSNIEITPEIPTVNDHLLMSVKIKDDDSGIARAYILISGDGFRTFDYYPLYYDSDSHNYEAIIPKMDPGVYSYGVIAFDFCNNYNCSLEHSNKIPVLSIPEPIQSAIYLSEFIILLGFVGAISIAGYLYFGRNSVKENTEFLVLFDENSIDIKELA